MRYGNQTTLRSWAVLDGFGVHSNSPVKLTLSPSEAGSGITFLRTGLEGGHERLIAANWGQVSATQLCTALGEGAAGVQTVEHLMAAISGLGVDNVQVEIDGPEVPIMDGSAHDFVEAIDSVGIETLDAPRRYLKILKTVRVSHGDAYSELRPAARGFKLDVEIDFAEAIIGRQRCRLDLEPGRFRKEISRARTFGFVSDVKRLWQAGFALGSSLENSVALEDGRILNPEGLRFADEFARHKTLDAVGDLALAGAPIIGAYSSYRGGHRMNFAVLEALFADPEAYTYVQDSSRTQENARRDSLNAFGQADVGLAGIPAFSPKMK